MLVNRSWLIGEMTRGIVEAGVKQRREERERAGIKETEAHRELDNLFRGFNNALVDVHAKHEKEDLE